SSPEPTSPRRSCFAPCASAESADGGANTMKAYVLITTSPGHALDVARGLGETEGILSADAITGEFDVIAICQADDVDQVGRLIVDRIQKVEGVFKTVTCLAMR